MSRFFRVQQTYSTLLDQQQARGIYGIAIGIILLVIVGIPVLAGGAFPDEVTRRFIVLGFSVQANIFIAAIVPVAASILVLYALRRGRLDSARVILVSGMFLYALTANLIGTTNDFRNVLLITYFIPVVVAGALLKRQGILIVLLGCLSAVILHIALISLGVLRYLDGPVQSGFVFFTLLELITCGLFLYFFAGGQRTLLQSNLSLISELRGLITLNQILSEGTTLSELLNFTLNIVNEQLGYFFAKIYLVEPYSGVLTLMADAGGDREPEQRRVSLNSTSILAEVARSGRTQRIGMDAPPARRTEFSPSARAELLIPLRANGQVVGVLDVQSVNPSAFTAQEIEGLETLSAQIALGILSLQQRSRLDQSERDQQELIEQVRSGSREIERLVQEVSGKAWQSFIQSRADKAVSFDWNGDMITTSDKPLMLPPRTRQGFAPHVETRGKVQVLIVPIVSRGQPLGVMEFTAPPGEFWDERSLELARAIAQRLALSLDNLRLYEQAQLAVTREQIANSVATQLQSKSDVDMLVTTAVDAFQQALGALQTSVRLGIPISEAKNKQTDSRAMITSTNGSHQQALGNGTRGEEQPS